MQSFHSTFFKFSNLHLYTFKNGNMLLKLSKNRTKSNKAPNMTQNQEKLGKQSLCEPGYCFRLTKIFACFWCDLSNYFYQEKFLKKIIFTQHNYQRKVVECLFMTKWLWVQVPLQSLITHWHCNFSDYVWSELKTI